MREGRRERNTGKESVGRAHFFCLHLGGNMGLEIHHLGNISSVMTNIAFAEVGGQVRFEQNTAV